MRFALIDAEKAEFPVRTMCRLLDVSESGFFAWQGRPASQRQRDDMIYLAHIRTAFELSNRTYGSPRMHRELVDEGLPIGDAGAEPIRIPNGELRLRSGAHAFELKQTGGELLARTAWPRARSVVSNEPRTVRTPGRSCPICWTKTSRQRRQTRNGAPTSPTSGPPRDGSISPCSTLDLFSRRVVGWAVSDRLKKDLALRALRMALVTRHPPSGLIHHSDRGSQYCSIDYQAVLRKHDLLISMSGKGNCYDNAVVETFFKTIKSELIWPVAWQTRCQAENAVARYIDGFYNPIRRHSTLGYQSPVQFEMAGRA